MARNDYCGVLYVFVNSKGPARGGRLKKHNVWRDFQAIRVKAGLPEFSLQDMRKSYCTYMAEAREKSKTGFVIRA